MVKPGDQPTKKIPVSPSTRQDIAGIRGEYDFDVHMLRVVREGDFIELKSDDEYRRIREEMKKSGGRRL